MSRALEPAFSHDRYLLVRPLFSFRRQFRVFGPDGSLVAYVEQPFFVLRQELIVYGDEEGLDPILVIKNRRLIGWNLEHDIFHAKSGDRLCVIRNRGFSSLFRDQWDILDGGEQPVGEIVESGNAFLRRVLRFLNGRHVISLGGETKARVTQVFHFFRREFVLEILPSPDPIEPRLAIACALICILADLSRERQR